MDALSDVLLLYGHHRGTTASFIQRGLERLGVGCFAVGPGHAEGPRSFPCGPAASLTTILARLQGRFRPSRIWVLESGVKFFPSGLESSPLPCWYYAIDPHFNLGWQVEYAKLFDAVLVSFRQYLPAFERSGHPRVHWLPHGYDSDYYRDHHLERTLDLAFVGDMDPIKRPQRQERLQALEASGLSCRFTRGIWNEEVARLYSTSRMVFNDNDSQVLNPRNFEGAACGAVVLANPAWDLDAFFRLGEEILLHHSTAELLEQARALAGDEVRRKRLAEAGRAAAQRCAWEHRLEDLQTAARTWDSPSPPHPWGRNERRRAQAFVYLQRGLPGECLRLLEQLQTEEGPDGEGLLTKALAYLSHGFPADAAREFLALLRLEPPPDPSLLSSVAEPMLLAFEQGDPAHAREAAERLLARLPALDPRLRARIQRLLGGTPTPGACLVENDNQ
ncbi:MAG: glycosyltransferase [Magnetococcales bacterium]|nr:glycosyltransferase [Magnetococcales bacterium]